MFKQVTFLFLEKKICFKYCNRKNSWYNSLAMSAIKRLVTEYLFINTSVYLFKI